MKAYNLYAVNDIRYEDAEIPCIEKGWALIRVKAAGICSSDIPRIFERGTYHFPTIPGHEFSGNVEQVGSEEDRDLIGKRVGVFPLIPCGQCCPCQEKRYEMCENYDYLGSRRDGGFAEYVAAPVWNLLPLPDGISYTAAAMLEPLSVALHAAKRAHIQEGDTVAVIGSGMIGFAVAQWAKEFRAGNVTVFGHSEHKQALADQMGVEYITPKNKKNTWAFSKVIEAVGSAESIEQAIQITKAGGTIVLMGNPTGNITLPQDVYWRILRKQITLTGTWNSSYEHDSKCDWSEVCEKLETGNIKAETLISHYYKQQDLMRALLMMKENKETYCKVMVNWDDK